MFFWKKKIKIFILKIIKQNEEEKIDIKIHWNHSTNKFIFLILILILNILKISSKHKKRYIAAQK